MARDAYLAQPLSAAAAGRIARRQRAQRAEARPLCCGDVVAASVTVAVHSSHRGAVSAALRPFERNAHV